MSSTFPTLLKSCDRLGAHLWRRSSRPARFAIATTMAALVVAYGAPPLMAQGALGSAQSFGVLGASGVTNTGPTTITGDLGVWPGTSITGSGTVTLLGGGVIHNSDPVAHQAQNDASTAFTTLSALPYTTDLSGQDLGGLTLTPGVYYFSSSAQLTGALFLNFLGDPSSRFVFQIGTALTTATASSVTALPGHGNAGGNVFWLAGSSATLGTGTMFDGNIIANQSVTLTTGAQISCGRAIALNGAVTMDSNVINDTCSGAGTIPEPSSVALLGTGLLGIVPMIRRRRA